MLILSIGLLAGGILKFVFFPEIVSDFLQVEVEMNEGTAPAQTEAAIRQIQDALWEVDRQVSEENGLETRKFCFWGSNSGRMGPVFCQDGP